MNVASLELCKELYELSGWDGTHHYYAEHELDGNIILPYCDEEHKDWYECPAYDLGYLLRKLPHEINGNYIMVGGQFEGQYSCGYYITVADAFTYEAIADTPEDAACKLAIGLIRQGVLTRQDAAG